MRKTTKTYNVYKYDELSKEVQEKLLEEYTQQECYYYIEDTLYADMIDESIYILPEYFKGAKFDNVCFDLSYSQGSGSMIEFTIDLEDLNDKYKILTDKQLKTITDMGGTEIKVYHDSNIYCHERTFSISEYLEIDDDKILKKVNHMIYNLFHSDIISMNKELTIRGYKMIGNEEYFKENALNTLNELEFLEDGSVFNE